MNFKILSVQFSKLDYSNIKFYSEHFRLAIAISNCYDIMLQVMLSELHHPTCMCIITIVINIKYFFDRFIGIYLNYVMCVTTGGFGACVAMLIHQLVDSAYVCYKLKLKLITLL